MIDFGELSANRAELVEQIIQASQEFGFFQLINHGVSEKLMHDVLDVAKEFFALPVEDKAKLYSEDPKQPCRLRTSIDYDGEKVHFWRDNLRHPCFPPGRYMEFWPEKPARYREVIGRYSMEMRKLSLWLLDLIAEGFGLEPGSFLGEPSEVQLMSSNYFPPCPDPSLTLGMPAHCDPNLITLILQEEVCGLQVLKDGKWLTVEPHPHVFFVNVGCMLHIMSNGKLRSPEHRVLTNKNVARTTITSFIEPSKNCMVGPVKSLLNECAPLYRDVMYKDFLGTYPAFIASGVSPLERQKIQY